MIGMWSNLRPKANTDARLVQSPGVGLQPLNG